MSDATVERVFQDDIINQMESNGWRVGTADNYDREMALYSSDLIEYVKTTEPDMWDIYCGIYGSDPEGKFLSRVVKQLGKASSNSSTRELKTFGTLGVLRNELKDRGCRFNLCQFKPDHGLNEETMDRYNKNILRVVPEVVYSPWAVSDGAKKYRIDLVLFLNGIPIATLELKSEFKQSVNSAKKQYKETRLPIDPVTKKPEPLLTFKRGALVHFAVSQTDVYMTTKLDGPDTYFLPFNKGTKDGGKGNDIPEDINRYATDYLWNEVLLKDNIINIIHRFIHLQIEDKEDWEGRKYKKETMIFPRYHQWDVVRKLISTAKEEGPGQKYLIQHSAGSGKSNSIAWTAHQLSSLTKDDGSKLFNSVIVVTDRTVLDSQLQDTIYQFDHEDGVVGRINRKEGTGSKSEKLASALECSQPIIIVTIQTFPFVLKSIENSVSLKKRSYAIIADEAHSSQTGRTAKEMKKVLQKEEKDNVNTSDEELTSEDILDDMVASQIGITNLSYFAFTATPKPKTVELFGRLPNPNDIPSSDNKPEAFHVYSMRQAIEEGFILDVLKNYTSYKVAYNLAQKMEEKDREVDAKKAKVKLNKWVRLHDYNIAQKVGIIIEHYKENIMHLLGGKAKAMVVTSSRKEAVRYKIAFDKYIKEKGYNKIRTMIAFSGEVEFTEKDPNSKSLLGEKLTETKMNPELKGREMRKAFDSEDYQVMIVANKFQTGFDQPKLCAMYVDKKLGGVECVQTLSRLNRVFPGKHDCGTFVLDFFNDTDEVLASFQQYYQTAELSDVSDPDQVYDLFEKLRAADIFTWPEVKQFCENYLLSKVSNAALNNICTPAKDRWKKRYKSALEEYKVAKDMFKRAKKTGDAVLIANADNDLKECKIEKDFLEMFKKDLGSYTRYYDFISQIVDFNDKELEMLSLYARHLRPMLREEVTDEDDVDLDNVFLSHYRLSKIKEQDLKLKENEPVYMEPVTAIGSAKAKDKKEDFLSRIINRINDIFIDDELSDNDKLNFMKTLEDKVGEDKQVMSQVENNTKEQIMLGDFPVVFQNAVMDSFKANNKMGMALLNDQAKMNIAMSIILDLMKSNLSELR